MILHVSIYGLRNCARWVPHSWTEDPKALRVDWYHTMLKTSNMEKLKTSTISWQVAKSGFIIMSQKQNDSRQSGAFLTTNQRLRCENLAVEEEMWLYQLTVTAEWYTTHCLPKVISTWQSQHPNQKREWKNEFSQWFLKIHKCIETKGEYFEMIWEALSYFIYFIKRH